MMKVLAIGLAGALGTIARYLTHQFVSRIISIPFPTGTFLVNILGCFLIGIITGFAEKSAIVNTEWRTILAVGFCGGFTTFSAFALENYSLIKQGHHTYFILYTLLSIVLGLAAVWLGILVTKFF